uniref:Uncharacterized protein n=1 Tax=Parastrongyloides trichosuri TaxID=131310 RepID=A0A0N5A324_PARTI
MTTGQNFTCPQLFAFDCDQPNCCDNYHMRFVFLLFTVGILAMALLVALIWLLFEFNVVCRCLRNKFGKKNHEISEIDVKSYEETKYLRRLSELNPNCRRDMIES